MMHEGQRFNVKMLAISYISLKLTLYMLQRFSKITGFFSFFLPQVSDLSVFFQSYQSNIVRSHSCHLVSSTGS
jgi:hypothetical protein